MELAKLQEEFKDYLGSLNSANNTESAELAETSEVSDEIQEEVLEDDSVVITISV